MTAAEIQARLQEQLPEARAEVRDTTGGGDHFEAIVVSPAFAGKSMVDRHRMVYGVLGAAVGGEIHALALRTYTPEQWKDAQGGTA